MKYNIYCFHWRFLKFQLRHFLNCSCASVCCRVENKILVQLFFWRSETFQEFRDLEKVTSWFLNAKRWGVTWLVCRVFMLCWCSQSSCPGRRSCSWAGTWGVCSGMSWEGKGWTSWSTCLHHLHHARTGPLADELSLDNANTKTHTTA